MGDDKMIVLALSMDQFLNFDQVKISGQVLNLGSCLCQRPSLAHECGFSNCFKSIYRSSFEFVSSLSLRSGVSHSG